MIVYIDADYKCHTTGGAGLTAVETDFFDGKCREFIEGYRYVPSGSTWVREDGVEFRGEMVAPWKDYGELAAAQAAWEHEELERLRAEKASLEAAYAEGVASA